MSAIKTSSADYIHCSTVTRLSQCVYVYTFVSECAEYTFRESVQIIMNGAINNYERAIVIDTACDA